jgi:DNA-binding winged helix-turn-helix (wHTH) protein
MAETPTVRFDEFTFDLSTRQLRRGATSVHLTLKAFDLLALLIERRPAAVSKEDIQARLWPDTFVSEANLPSLVAEIRTALGDTARTPRFIRTVHGFGYAFSGTAHIPESSGAPQQRSRYSLTWESRHLPLFEGENIVGRDRDVAVWLDGTSISRRHCMILVSGPTVTVKDLDSKNGTYVRDQRLTSPAPASAGDRIRVGSLVLTLRLDDMASTETQSTHDSRT